MEPDQRHTFRRDLRADAARVTAPPHKPTDECWGQHCSWHDVDEQVEGAYRVCAECGHAYRTAEALREAWADVTADGYGLPPGTDVIAPPVEQIHACPYCAHGW